MSLLAYRRNPWVRRGYGIMMDGLKSGHDARAWAGVAMMSAGLAVQRGRIKRLRRRPVYRADLDTGESMAIRVRRSGEVITAVDIPAAGS